MQHLKKGFILCVAMFLLIKPYSAQPLKTYAHYILLEKQRLEEESGVLLMSNSPEDVKEVGVLYQGELWGKGRLLYHHVNESEEKNLRLVIEIVNQEKTPQLLRIRKAVVDGPSYRFLKTGQTLLRDYFNSVSDELYYLQPEEKWILYDSEGKLWTKGSLLSGMMDVETTGLMTVTYKAISNESGKEATNLKILEKDLAPRGSFNILERTYTMEVPAEIGYYYHLLGTPKDWVKGIDELTGENALNEGNYGIMEHIRITAKADTTVILCPRGGIFQGVVRWDDGSLHLVERSHSFKRKKECIEIGKLKKGETKQLDYMLPNGSAAPALLGFWVK